MTEPKAIKPATLTKAEFEEILSASITDEQWAKVQDEVEGRVDNFLDGLLSDLIEDFKEGVGVFDGEL